MWHRLVAIIVLWLYKGSFSELLLKNKKIKSSHLIVTYSLKLEGQCTGRQHLYQTRWIQSQRGGKSSRMFKCHDKLYHDVTAKRCSMLCVIEKKKSIFLFNHCKIVFDVFKAKRFSIRRKTEFSSRNITRTRSHLFTFAKQLGLMPKSPKKFKRPFSGCKIIFSVLTHWKLNYPFSVRN